MQAVPGFPFWSLSHRKIGMESLLIPRLQLYGLQMSIDGYYSIYVASLLDSSLLLQHTVLLTFDLKN